jgi:hypothetical protein
MLPGDGSLLLCSPTLGPTAPEGAEPFAPRRHGCRYCSLLSPAAGNRSRLSHWGTVARRICRFRPHPGRGQRLLNRLNRTQLDSTSQAARFRLPGALAGSEWTPLAPPAGQTKVAPSVSPTLSSAPPSRRFFADWAQMEWSLTRRLNADFWLHHVAFRQRQRISPSVTRRPLN